MLANGVTPPATATVKGYGVSGRFAHERLFL